MEQTNPSKTENLQPSVANKGKQFLDKVLTEKKYLFILLGIILLVQLSFIIVMACQKVEFHIDEIYSYILSNSYDAPKITSEDSVWDIWFDGESFLQFLTVQKGEGFAYGKVYYNNSLDAHPPLYYFLLHTICSLTPNVFSMWQGISLNILCFIGTQIFLYFISLRLFKNRLLACIPVLFYGFSPTALDTVLFIRMYALITMLTTILIYLHVRLLQDGVSWKWIILCGVVTFLGFFTQYFFAFLAALMAFAYCIYGLIKKEYKYTAIYAGVMLLAIALVFLIYPSAITQIVGSETNNVGKNVMANFFNIKLWISNIFSFVKQIIFNFFGGYISLFFITVICVLGIIGGISYVLIRKKKKGERLTVEKSTERLKEFSYKNIKFICVILAIIVGNIIVIAKMCGEFSYVRYLYNAFPIMVLGAVLLICFGLSKLTVMRLSCVCLAGFSLLNVLGVVINNTNQYLFKDVAVVREEVVETYEDIPLLLVTERKTYVPTHACTFILQYSSVYMMSDGNVEGIDEILSAVDTSKGFLCYIWTDTYWAQGYDAEEKWIEIQNNSAYVFDIEEIQPAMGFGTLYYVTVNE